MIGPWEIFMILVVVLLLFGAGRLPSVMGDVAKGVKAFKSGLKDEDAAQSKSEKDPEPPVRALTQNTAAPSVPQEKTQTDEHRF